MGLMLTLLRHPATIVWLILAGVTTFSWWLGAGSVAEAARSHPNITTGVILLSLVKVRLILFHFMEVREAPWPLRRICDAWIAIVGLLLVGLYRVGTPMAA